jgi:hypothetical protein
MALTGFNSGKKNNGGERTKYEPLSEGVHTGRLVQIIDLGIQQDEYQGVVSERHKVFFTFEIPGETINVKGEDLPKFISTELTVSLFEKAKLPSFVKSLDPKAKLDETLNLADLVGKGAQLNIGRTKTGNAKILNAMPLAKGMEIEETGTPLVVFDIDNQDEAVLAKLPKFIQDKIANSLSQKSAPKGGQKSGLPDIM